MNIIKWLLFFWAKLIIIPYALYIFIKVFKHTDIVELELLGSDNVTTEIIKIVEPFREKYKTPLRVFSILTWITIIINF